jgi:hypothetical protein
MRIPTKAAWSPPLHKSQRWASPQRRTSHNRGGKTRPCCGFRRKCYSSGQQGKLPAALPLRANRPERGGTDETEIVRSDGGRTT